MYDVSSTVTTTTTVPLQNVIPSSHLFVLLLLSYRQLSFTVFSGRATIGHVQLKLSALKLMEQDDMGYRTQIFPIFLDGLKRGTMKLRLTLTELKDDRPRDIRGSNKSSSETPISIPFVVRINRVAAVDIDPNMKQQFFGRNALALIISYDNWSKATLNCTVSNQKEWAEWMDDDWIFIVTNANSLFELFIMDGDHSIGSLSMNIRDILNTPRGKDGSTDMVAFMYRDGEYTIAKMRVLLTVAPYTSPEEQKALSNRMRSNHYQPQPTPIIGYLRIKHLHAYNLVQVLGLFRNSPRITITFGDWSASTNIAMDAGSEFIWDNLDWGRIPMRESALFVAKVTSGNEVIGRFRLTTSDFISVLPKDQSTIIIEGRYVSVILLAL